MNNEKKEKTIKGLFTVAVVTFQQRHLLEDCLNSILKQDYPSIELIICDDDSCDFSPDEVRDYLLKQKRENIKKITIFKQKRNVGTSANCQKALTLATGEYIKFQAGDDMLKDKNVLSSMVNFFKKESANVLVTRAQACSEDGTLLDVLYPPDGHFNKAVKSTPHQLFALIGTQPWGAFVCAPAVFFRKSYLCKLGGFDSNYKFTEDWPLWLKICERNEPLTYIDKVTTIYRMGGISNDLSYINAGLGERHYLECIKLLKDYVFPRLREYSVFDRIRCWYSIESIKARIIKEKKWNSWRCYEKFIWKCGKIPFFLCSTLYQFRNRSMYFSFDFEKKYLFLMAVLFYLNVPLYPEGPDRNLWAVGLVIGVLFIAIKYLVSVIVRFSKRFLDFRMKVIK